MNNRQDKRERERSCSLSAFSLQAALEFSTTHISPGHCPPGVSPWPSSQNSSLTIKCQKSLSTQLLSLIPTNHPNTLNPSHRHLHLYSCCSLLPQPNSIFNLKSLKNILEHWGTALLKSNLELYIQTSPGSNSDSATWQHHDLGQVAALPPNLSFLGCKWRIVIPISQSCCD